MTATVSTSAVRVFGKSMHMLAVGWALSVAWLWGSGVQQHILRDGVAPPNYAVGTLLTGVFPSALIALLGLVIEQWSGRAPTPALQTREWWHAFWWTVAPNAQLLLTVYIMIREGR